MGADFQIIEGIAQIGATGILGYMWMIARQDLKAEKLENAELRLELRAFHAERAKDQKEMIADLTKEPPA
jgi:hypothetical protein